MPGKKKAQKHADRGPHSEGHGRADSASSGGGIFRRLPSWWPLPIFMLVGLFFRLTTTLWEPLIFPDSMQYMHLAREIRSGQFFAPDYDLDQGFIKSRHLPPFYSFMLAPFAGSQADLERVGVVISLLMSILTFIPLYIAMVIIFSRRAALAACALLCFQTFIQWYASPILTESTFTFLFACVIAASARAFTRPGIGIFLVCGVFSTLLYLTRDVGITAAPLIAVLAFIKLRVLDRVAWTRTAALLSVLLVSFLVCSLPYFIHIRARTGQWGLTAQMSNTSITRQIRLFGGDRYDRDRINAKEETALIGGNQFGGVADFAAAVPKLAVKLVKNMGAYGMEAVHRLGHFLLVFVLVSGVMIFREYRAGKDREKLFLGIVAAGWIFQLWALYALITPYMVDDRYMYPVMIPAIMMAGFGMVSTSEWAAAIVRPGKNPAKITPGNAVDYLLPVVFACIYLVYQPALLQPDATKKFQSIFYGSPDWFFVFPLSAAAMVFFLALLPSVVALFFERIRRMRRRALIVLALLAAGVIALAIPAGDSRYIFYFPGELLVSGALMVVFISVVFSLGDAWAGRAPVLLAPFLVVAAFSVQVPDYLELYNRRSEASLVTKFASGHKAAAAEIKAMGIIPPGKVIVSRKPFMAYYLDGSWYYDEALAESIPKTLEEVEKLAASGKIDYLVADSFTLKALRPYLTGLAFAIKPPRGTSVVYSKYFPDYHRIITVYDCRRPERPIDAGGSIGDHLQKARQYYAGGYLPFAFREANRVLELDPANKSALFVKTQVLQIYYQNAYRQGALSLLTAPDVLPELFETAQAYAKLMPNDPSARALLKSVSDDYREESAQLEALKQRVLESNEKRE